MKEHDIDAIARKLHAKQQVPLISKDVRLSQDDTSSDALSFRPHLKFLRESEMPFDSAERRACVVSEMIRNYEVASTRHHTDMGKIPDDLSS